MWRVLWFDSPAAGGKLSGITGFSKITGVSGTCVTIPSSSIPSSSSVKVGKVVGLVVITSDGWVRGAVGVGGTSGIVSPGKIHLINCLLKCFI